MSLASTYTSNLTPAMSKCFLPTTETPIICPQAPYIRMDSGAAVTPHTMSPALAAANYSSHAAPSILQTRGGNVIAVPGSMAASMANGIRRNNSSSFHSNTTATAATAAQWGDGTNSQLSHHPPPILPQPPHYQPPQQSIQQQLQEQRQKSEIISYQASEFVAFSVHRLWHRSLIKRRLTAPLRPAMAVDIPQHATVLSLPSQSSVVDAFGHSSSSNLSVHTAPSTATLLHSTTATTATSSSNHPITTTSTGFNTTAANNNSTPAIIITSSGGCGGVGRGRADPTADSYGLANSLPLHKPLSISTIPTAVARSLSSEPIPPLASTTLPLLQVSVPFNSVVCPPGTRRWYPAFFEAVHTVLSRSGCSLPHILISLLYVARLRQMVPVHITGEGSEYRVFVSALILAQKFHSDDRYSNKAWSRITKLPLAEINTMEREFLVSIGYRLHVRDTDYSKWEESIRVLGQEHSVAQAAAHLHQLEASHRPNQAHSASDDGLLSHQQLLLPRRSSDMEVEADLIDSGPLLTRKTHTFPRNSQGFDRRDM
ncbi:hypothetical protein BASA50_009809 [Batrachochytrium salamandrivorans]|uniref:Cyclin N-terminal domain-containing protein n=1 Tax=Batrachochytrium salamandrivorans TaxID=1357716 RepID=A0ABQ8F092_9FUNG|nr:hypothetical protein BASA50_009809 [Batrachochytrium salamandrivorans]